VSALFDHEPDQIMSNVRYPVVVKARSVLSYWAVRELGYSATELAKKYGLTQPAVSTAVKRGEKIVKENGMAINEEL
jgi:putative transposase